LKSTANILIKKFGVQVLTNKTNITDENNVKDMVEKAISEFGKVDILINNAAIIGPMGEISDIDTEDFFATIRNNIGGTIFCTKAVLPYMKINHGGCIINLSGGGALYPLPYYDAYSASKASIVRLTENFAIEFEKYKISVTALSPGAVNTKMFEEQLKANKSSIGENNWKALQDRLKEGGDSIEKAPELALFIASNARPELNGKVISAIWDDWEMIADNAEKIIDSDIFNMRRIVPNDRNIDLK